MTAINLIIVIISAIMLYYSYFEILRLKSSERIYDLSYRYTMTAMWLILGLCAGLVIMLGEI